MKRQKGTNRKRRNNNVFISMVLGVIAIIALGIFLSYNIRKQNKSLEEWERYAIIGKNNVVVVYEDKLSVKIPFDIQVNKEKTIKDLVDSRNYELVLDTINGFLPEKVTNYKVMKYGELDLNVKNGRNIPEIVIDDKKYILTSGTESLFNDLYGGDLTKPENLVVDILNANGIGGYARRTGERLKDNLGVTYTAANYENNQEYSLIKINEIDRKNLEDILMNVNEKYFKIKEENDIPTLASVVLILGKESNIDFKIEVVGTSGNAKEVYKNLGNLGYKNLTLKEQNKNLDKSVIQYNKADYYIALKIAKKLNIDSMIENNELNDKIVILMN